MTTTTTRTALTALLLATVFTATLAGKKTEEQAKAAAPSLNKKSYDGQRWGLNGTRWKELQESQPVTTVTAKPKIEDPTPTPARKSETDRNAAEDRETGPEPKTTEEINELETQPEETSNSDRNWRKLKEQETLLRATIAKFEKVQVNQEVSEEKRQESDATECKSNESPVQREQQEDHVITEAKSTLPASSSAHGYTKWDGGEFIIFKNRQAARDAKQYIDDRKPDAELLECLKGLVTGNNDWLRTDHVAHLKKCPTYKYSKLPTGSRAGISEETIHTETKDGIETGNKGERVFSNLKFAKRKFQSGKLTKKSREPERNRWQHGYNGRRESQWYTIELDDPQSQYRSINDVTRGKFITYYQRMVQELAEVYLNEESESDRSY